MELLISHHLLAEQAARAGRNLPAPPELACAMGPPEARETLLMAFAAWGPWTDPPPARLVIRPAPFGIRRAASWRFLAQYVGPIARGTGVLWLGEGPDRGAFVGAANIGSGPEPITAVRMLGPGLDRVSAVDFPDVRTPAPGDLERWSRHIGALDADTWARQRALRIVVVGAGRTGSLAAATIARWGANLSIVDPDIVERHNLDASDIVVPADFGRLKAEALAAGLLRLQTGASIEAVIAPIESAEGREALANADVAVCCVDDDVARRYVGNWARRYGLVLLDVGVAIRRNGETWRAGADVRFIAPGDGCLECWGGIAMPDTAPAADWRLDRAGSLRTLNATAANLGLTLLEQYVAACRAGSAWLRLEIDPSGIPSITSIARGSRACVACAETLRGAHAVTAGP